MEVLRIKGNTRHQNTITEMKNGFDGLISRLDTAKGTISELERNVSRDFQNQNGNEKAQERTKYPRTVGQLQRYNGKKKRNKQNI